MTSRRFGSGRFWFWTAVASALPSACGGRTETLPEDVTWSGGSFSAGGNGGAPSLGGKFAGKAGTPNVSSGGRIGKGGASNGGAPNGGFAGWDAGGFAGWDFGGWGGWGGAPDLCPTCPCPQNPTGDVYVDPEMGASANGGEFGGTGVPYPARCRFKRLTQALASVPKGGRVLVTNDGNRARKFKFSGETFPLIVPNGVTLSGMVDGVRDRFEIEYSGPLGPAIVLRENTVLEGFVVSTLMGARGTLVACNHDEAAELDQVTLRADTGTAQALQLDCRASANRLSVSGGRVGIQIPDGNQDVRLSNVEVTLSETGILSYGSLRATQLDLRGTGDGIVVNDGVATVEFSKVSAQRRSAIALEWGKLTLQEVTISETGDAGMRVFGGDLVARSVIVHSAGPPKQPEHQLGSAVVLEGGASVTLTGGELALGSAHGIYVVPQARVGKLTVSELTIRDNASVGVYFEGIVDTFDFSSNVVSGNGGGGLLVNSPSLFTRFWQNRFYRNAVSQLEFNSLPSSGLWWMLGQSGDCSGANQIGCYLGKSMGISAGPGVFVDAGGLAWETLNPVSGRDYEGDIVVKDICAPASGCPSQ